MTLKAPNFSPSFCPTTIMAWVTHWPRERNESQLTSCAPNRVSHTDSVTLDKPFTLSGPGVPPLKNKGLPVLGHLYGTFWQGQSGTCHPPAWRVLLPAAVDSWNFCSHEADSSLYQLCKSLALAPYTVFSRITRAAFAQTWIQNPKSIRNSSQLKTNPRTVVLPGVGRSYFFSVCSVT